MEKELMLIIWEIDIKEIGWITKDLALESILCPRKNIFILDSGKTIKCMGGDFN